MTAALARNKIQVERKLDPAEKRTGELNSASLSSRENGADQEAHGQRRHYNKWILHTSQGTLVPVNLFTNAIGRNYVLIDERQITSSTLPEPQ